MKDARLVIGAVIIKHKLCLSDMERPCSKSRKTPTCNSLLGCRGINRLNLSPQPDSISKSFSLMGFMKRYSSESQCAEALFQARWPSGFQCPGCGGRRYSVVKTRNLYQYTACHHQTSLISGTLFEQTKLPLTVWFLAIHLLTQAKTSMSALALKRQIGVSYITAWSLKHKIMQTIKERDDCKPQTGIIEVETSTGAASIGAENAGEARKTRRLLLQRWR